MMAIKPVNHELPQDGSSVVNATLNSLGDVGSSVPRGSLDDMTSSRVVFAAMEQSGELTMNMFIDTLLNRIGRTVIESRSYESPLAKANIKKGLLTFGNAEQEIAFNIAKGSPYDATDDTSKLFKYSKPEIFEKIHITNSRAQYAISISYEQLKEAFMDWNSFNNFFNGVITSITNAMNADELLIFKYLLANEVQKAIAKDPKATLKVIGDVIPTDPTAVVKNIKNISNKFTFPVSSWNKAGRTTFTPKENQVLAWTCDADSEINVDVLSAAFQLDKAEFMKRRLLLDGLTEDYFDKARLEMLTNKVVPEYTAETLAKFVTNALIIFDENYIQCYDNLIKMSPAVLNGKTMYWNYFLNVFKTFSVSPFNNAIVVGNIISGAKI